MHVVSIRIWYVEVLGIVGSELIIQGIWDALIRKLNKTILTIYHLEALFAPWTTLVEDIATAMYYYYDAYSSSTI